MVMAPEIDVTAVHVALRRAVRSDGAVGVIVDLYDDNWIKVDRDIDAVHVMIKWPCGGFTCVPMADYATVTVH